MFSMKKCISKAVILKVLSLIMSVLFILSVIPFEGSTVKADGTSIKRVMCKVDISKITLNPAYSESEVVSAFINSMNNSTYAGYTVSTEDCCIAYKNNGKMVRKGSNSNAYVDQSKDYYLCFGLKPNSGYDWPAELRNYKYFDADKSVSIKSFKNIAFQVNGSNDLDGSSKGMEVSYDSNTNIVYLYYPINYRTLDINDLDSFSITNIKNKQYDGNAKTQEEMVLARGGYTLNPDTDYSILYINNVNVGRATAIIIGKGFFSGQKSVYFYITKGLPSNSDDNNYYSDEKAKGNASDTGASTGSGAANTASGYKNEWVKGKWYNSQGVNDYNGTLEWKSNSTGWWVEDTAGWYPVSQWQKIDGKWYYFTSSGYMDYSEYRDGYWLGSDGALVDGYFGQWKSDSTGWWFEDTSGWYPSSQYVWIDGVNYYFNASGYWA